MTRNNGGKNVANLVHVIKQFSRYDNQRLITMETINHLASITKKVQYLE